MDLERRIAQLSGRRLTIELPEGFENRRVEVTVSPIDDVNEPPCPRRPDPKIAGQVKIHSDIFDTVSAEEWHNH